MASSRRESGGASDSSASDEEVPTDRRSFPQPYAFKTSSSRVNYHDDAESSGSESDDGFQGVDLEVANRTSGTYWCQCGNCVRCLPTQSVKCTCSAEIANIQRRNSQAHSLALGCISENRRFLLSAWTSDLEVLNVALLPGA